MSSISSSPPPALPPIGANNNRMDDDVATPGVKREAGSPVTAMRYAKKPRDNRLRECFIITPIEGGGESIICKHCPDYNKTLQKFNPTKARSHLTAHCPGVDDALRQLLLDTTQAAKKSQSQIEASEAAAITISTAIARSSAEKAASAKMRKLRGRNRSSPSYISVHTEDTTLDITAPIENDELLLRLSFPSDNLKLNFNAEKNIFGAALCIDGFMNLKSHATWTASMCSMTSEGTRAGPHCQWPLNPDASGKFEGGLTRVQKVEQILKALIMI